MQAIPQPSRLHRALPRDFRCSRQYQAETQCRCKKAQRDTDRIEGQVAELVTIKPG